MAFSLSANRIAAVVVLLGAAAWVITGEFSAVGSQEAEAAQKAPDAAAEGAAPALRTVAAIVPVFADYSRQIRISGATEADKVAVLAARADGIVQSLEVKQGQQIAANDVVARLEGTDVEAAVRNGEVALARAEQELKVGEELYARGSLPELDLGTRRTAKAAAEAKAQGKQEAETKAKQESEARAQAQREAEAQAKREAAAKLEKDEMARREADAKSRKDTAALDAIKRENGHPGSSQALDWR